MILRARDGRVLIRPGELWESARGGCHVPRRAVVTAIGDARPPQIRLETVLCPCRPKDRRRVWSVPAGTFLAGWRRVEPLEGLA